MKFNYFTFYKSFFKLWLQKKIFHYRATLELESNLCFLYICGCNIWTNHKSQGNVSKHWRHRRFVNGSFKYYVNTWRLFKCYAATSQGKVFHGAFNTLIRFFIIKKFSKFLSLLMTKFSHKPQISTYTEKYNKTKARRERREAQAIPWNRENWPQKILSL